MKQKETNKEFWELFLDLSRENVLLFHRLKAMAEALHGEGELTAARRGVLLSLQHGGPQTVPQMARIRPVTRQFMQAIVNLLKKDDLVETKDNPAHKKSRLIVLTKKGERHIKTIKLREKKFLEQFQPVISSREIQSACTTLKKIREGLETHSQPPGKVSN